MFEEGMYVQVLNFLKTEDVNLKGYLIEVKTKTGKKITIKIASKEDYQDHNYFIQIEGKPFFWIGDSIEEFKKDITSVFLTGGK